MKARIGEKRNACAKEPFGGSILRRSACKSHPSNELKLASRPTMPRAPNISHRPCAALHLTSPPTSLRFVDGWVLSAIVENAFVKSTHGNFMSEAALKDLASSTSPTEYPMTVREAAKFLGVSQQTVYLWVERKQIPHLRVMGRNIRFLRSDLETFRASFRQEMENA
jgi:excisionase family DNA binding protein